MAPIPGGTLDFNVSLITPDDPEYVNWGRRRAEKRRMLRVSAPRRNMGEKIGWVVEQSARHHLSTLIPLQSERILRWQIVHEDQTRASTLYREIDAVHSFEEGYAFYEIKLTASHRIASGHGLTQLKAASKTFRQGQELNPRVILRLVYIAEEPMPVLSGKIPSVHHSDITTTKGVIWITPSQIESAARELGLELPSNWMSPEARNASENHQSSSVRVGEDFFETSLTIAFRKATKNL